MYLFSTLGRKRLQAICTATTLFAFDFDGTLAPIAKDHKKARLARVTRQLLRDLALHAQVAVISGRGRDDLDKRVGLRGVYLVGNHGLEGAADNKKTSLYTGVRTFPMLPVGLSTDLISIN